MENGHGVYDFTEDDERTETAAERIVTKYKNPNLDDSAILKYNLLECVPQGNHVQKKGISSVICVNVDSVDRDPGCDNETTYAPPEADGEHCGDRTPQLNATSCEQIPCLKKDNYGSGSFLLELASRDSCSGAQLPGKSQLNCGISDSLSNNEPVALKSDADESMDEDSPLSPASDAVDDSASLDGHVSDHCFDELEMDDIDMAVVIHPDYVVYQDNFCSGTTVTFSCTSIKVEDSAACGSQGTFIFERGIDDIIDVNCQWFQRIGSIVVKLRVLSKDAVQDDDTKGTSGIEELEFAVVECNWSETQEKITLLNAKYKAVWNIVVDDPMEMDGDNSFQRRQYFPNFDEPFEEVVYPKGDSDAVSLSMRDVDLLQPETFVNDTIIDFYIKYLKNQIQAEEKHRFHFFNSFFFRKLADLDKDPSSISDGKAAFLRVRKWTRKVDIFGKDYIFIPVNFNLHWSLIIICHLGEVVAFDDEDLDKSERVPCILHMDSIKGTHAGLKNLVQSYLCEEWKERHEDLSEDISSKFLNMRFVPLELPQQENSFDCGLFLLHYLELFLAEAPVNFSPFKLTKFSNFLNVDWFPPGEASLKRTLIQKLIFELLEIRSREAKSAVCRDEHQSCRFQDDNEIETGVELLSQNHGPAIAQHGNLSNSWASQGIEITLLGASSVRNLPCANDSGLVLREFLEGATAGSLLAQYQSFGQPSSYYHLNGTISMREEGDVEAGEEFVYLPSGENGFQQITELTAQASTNPYSSRGFETATSWKPAIPMQREHDADSSPETSLCASDDSEEVGIIENSPLAEDASQSLKERTNQQSSPSTNNIGYLTERVASVSNKMLQISTSRGSEEPDKMHLSNENIDLPSCQENLTTLLQDRNSVENRLHQDSEMVENRLHQDIEMDENREFSCDDVQVIGDDLQAESYEQQQAANGLQFNPREEEQGFTGSLSKDLHL